MSGEDTLFGLDGGVGREVSRDSVAQVLAAALQQEAAKNKVQRRAVSGGYRGVRLLRKALGRGLCPKLCGH